jgi:hypothetical protein
MSEIQKNENKDLTQHSEIENIQAAAKEDSGFEEFLTFKKGHYFVGDDEIPLGTKFIAYAKSWVKIWIKFVEGEPPQRQVYRVALGERPPERDELDDLDDSKWTPGLDDKPSDPWVFQFLLPLENVDSGEVLIFKTQSFGGKRAVAKLCETWAKRAGRVSGCGSPIVKLAASEMPSKKWGRVPAPHFEIINWDDRATAEPDVLPPAPNETPAAPSTPRKYSPDRITSGLPKNSGGNADLDDEIPW